LVAPPQQVLVVEPPLGGVLLADFLERACPGDRLDLRRLVASGAVRVNGMVCTTSRRLRIGDVVQVPLAAPRAPKSRRGELPAVLFDSASVVVVDKPAGVTTVPDRTGDERGIHGLLDDLRPGADLRIVHRLDRDTSGCLLLAKGVAAARHFDAQFQSGAVTKKYVALVDGLPVEDRFAIDAWLGPDRKRPGKVVAAPKQARGCREAHTAVAVRARFLRHALVDLWPATGRTHQLRVHLASVGHPIVADADYGGEPLLLSSLKDDYKLRRGRAERPLLARMFLHAERVEFTDLDGAACAVESPLPRDLAAALRKVETHGPVGRGS